MKKILFLSIIATIVFLFNFFESNAATPSDFGLKEGDLISAIFSDDPDVYIINENGYKRLFLNPEIFKFYSHLGGFANIKLVTPEVRDAFPTSGLFRNCESDDQKVYGVDVEDEDAGQFHWVNTTGEQAIKDDPNFFKKVFCINNKEFGWYPRAHSFNSVIEVPRYDRIKEKERISTRERLENKTELKDIGQVIICHYPLGNPENFQTLTVGATAVKAHLEHGDIVGPCLISIPSSTPFPTITVSPTPTPVVSIFPTPTLSPSPLPTPTLTPMPTATIVPTLIVVYPNGHETLAYGSRQVIKWTGGDSSWPINIRIMQNNLEVKTVALNTPNDGSEVWTVNVPDANNYYVYIDGCHGCPGPYTPLSYDYSDYSFSVSGAPVPTPGPTSQLDLIVFNIYNDAGKLSVKIGNVGTATAPSNIGHLYIWIDDVLKWTYSLSTLADQSFLLPGGTTVVQPQVLYGDHKIKVVIDPQNVIYESNETNNIMEKTVTFPPQPVSSKITVVTPNGGENFIANSTQTIRWTGGDPSWPILIQLVMQSPFQVYSTIATNTANDYEEVWTIPSTVPAGSYFIYVQGCRDCTAGSAWDYSDYSFNISGAPTPTPTPTPISISTTDKPDLTIFDIYNDNGKLSIRFGNIGTIAAPSNTGSLYIWIDDKLAWTYGLPGIYNQDFLLPGGSTIGQPQYLSGQHKIKVTIDPTNTIAESNENNNTLEKTLTFGITPNITTQSNFLHDLTVGSTGDDVKQLQALLVNEVGYSADLTTGYFGRITRDAVKKLQEKYGIKPTYGYFGAITRKTLNALMSN